jgi:hypothetical protein
MIKNLAVYTNASGSRNQLTIYILGNLQNIIFHLSTKQLDYLVNNTELFMQVVSHGKPVNTNPSA